MRSSSIRKRLAEWIVGCAAVALIGCPPPDDDGDTDVDGGMDTVADTDPDTEFPDTEMDTSEEVGSDADGGDAADGTDGPTEFRVTLTNRSDESGTPSPFAPGAWALHTSADPFFTTGNQDRGEGLETLAEDGGGAKLASNVANRSGVTEADAFAPNPPGPLGPGQSLTFTVSAEAGDGALSFASMLVQTNDVFAAPESGIELFDANGEPKGRRDVTDELAFFDAGTERNQAPWHGPDQPPRAKNSGAKEGVVAPFSDATRALPIARGIVDVRVSTTGGGFDVTVENVSKSKGAIVTPVAPVFYAVHDSSWSFFSPDSSASAALETLAEDGSPADLVAAHSSDSGTGSVGAAKTPSGGSAGPAKPGETFEFTVAPSSSARELSFAAMVVQSNDAFLALRGGGVDLMDGSGNTRSASAVEDEIERRLAVWDAGTEANQVPGAGSNQPPRQSGPDTGPADSTDRVRLYTDGTNDLSGPMAGGFVDVTITHGSGSKDFDVTVANTSGSTAYTGVVTPVAWAVTDGSVTFFDKNQPASSGLERLAERGKTGAFLSGLSSSGVASSGTKGSGPIQPGDSVTITVTPDATHRYLNIASMVVPSNDTFLSMGPKGIKLLDSNGNRRSESALSTAVKNKLKAYDAGTEANQAGAAGPDQPPRVKTNQGPPEGDGTVRKLMGTPWSYPDVADVLKVTVEPK